MFSSYKICYAHQLTKTPLRGPGREPNGVARVVLSTPEPPVASRRRLVGRNLSGVRGGAEVSRSDREAV
jgi:hypothetical protein